MPHVPDLSGAHEALFQLRHLAQGSREFCKRELLHFGDDDYTPEEWETYQGQLHFLVSRTLISTAANFRVLQETLRSGSEGDNLATAEEELGLTQQAGLGEVLEGEFNLTLRESCNKILHATEFDLLFHESRAGKPSRRYSHWSGEVHIVGSKGGREWKLMLAVPAWCVAVDNYFECFSGDLEWR